MADVRLDSSALSISANPLLSPLHSPIGDKKFEYDVDNNSNLIEFIKKSCQIIFQSRQLFSDHLKNVDTNHDDYDDSFQLNLTDSESLNELLEIECMKWNPNKSSLTLTIDLCISFDGNETKQLVERWKIIFNHSDANSSTNNNNNDEDSKEKEKDSENQQNRENEIMDYQMIIELRSLMSYIVLLPIVQLLTPLTVVKTMDLFNLGLDVENDANLSILQEKSIEKPYELSYSLTSSLNKKTKENESKNDAITFDNSLELNYHYFPWIEYREIGSLQLSVFYVDDDDYLRLNDESVNKFVQQNRAKKRLNSKYLEMQFDRYIEEQKQQQLVRDAMQGITENDEDIAMLEEQDDDDNDKKDGDNDKENTDNANKSSDNNEPTKGNNKKMFSGFLDKVVDGASKGFGHIKSEITSISTTLPRPYGLNVLKLTANVAVITWKMNDSFVEFNKENNAETRKFKFEIRCKRGPKVVHVDNGSDNDGNGDIDDVKAQLENRPVIIKETFNSIIEYNDLKKGEMYKFQVRIVDSKNSSLCSNWSSTICVVVPNQLNGNDDDGDESKTVTGNGNEDVHLYEEANANFDHTKFVKALSLEELQYLCIELLAKTEKQKQELSKLREQNILERL